MLVEEPRLELGLDGSRPPRLAANLLLARSRLQVACTSCVLDQVTLAARRSELYRGAEERNRTSVTGVSSRRSTIELRPRSGASGKIRTSTLRFEAGNSDPLYYGGMVVLRRFELPSQPSQGCILSVGRQNRRAPERNRTSVLGFGDRHSIR